MNVQICCFYFSHCPPQYIRVHSGRQSKQMKTLKAFIYFFAHLLLIYYFFFFAHLRLNFVATIIFSYTLLAKKLKQQKTLN